jgi:hypothetical protein
VRDRFYVRLTQSTEEALNFLCRDLSAAQEFPVDRPWIAPTNRLAREINERMQEWRWSGARNLGRLQALIYLISPCRTNSGLNEAHQIDFVRKIETPDLAPHILHFPEGDPCMPFRNIRTLSGLIKGRRCWIVKTHQHLLVSRLDSGEELTLSRILIGKVSNALKFAG